MKKIVICLFALANILTANAQNSTTGQEEVQSKESSKSSVLVIPFESKMYLSDIDRDLGEANDLNFQDIKAKFRAALDREIFIALKSYFNPLSFYAIETKEARAELGYIYNSIGYQYELVPEEELAKKENIGKKLIGKFKKKEKEEKLQKAIASTKKGIAKNENQILKLKSKLEKGKAKGKLAPIDIDKINSKILKMNAKTVKNKLKLEKLLKKI